MTIPVSLLTEQICSDRSVLLALNLPQIDCFNAYFLKPHLQLSGHSNTLKDVSHKTTSLSNIKSHITITFFDFCNRFKIFSMVVKYMSSNTNYCLTIHVTQVKETCISSQSQEKKLSSFMN